MQFNARALYVPYSPYKLRPIADVVRGKPVLYALGWLQTYKTQRTIPVRKAIESAAANAKNLNNLALEDLRISEIRIDQGPQHRYFKPGSMGRSIEQRRRLCHILVIVESLTPVTDQETGQETLKKSRAKTGSKKSGLVGVTSRKRGTSKEQKLRTKSVTGRDTGSSESPESVDTVRKKASKVAKTSTKKSGKKEE